MPAFYTLSTAVVASLISLHVSAASMPAALSNTGITTITTSDGVALKADIAGAGVPCVFVHGGPGAGSEVAQKLGASAFEKSCRMIWLDQRGAGRSASDPKKDYSLARVVQDFEEVRQQLKIEKWVLVSHSFGGIIAAEYARKYPDHVSGLVLVNSILNLPASMESVVQHGYAFLPASKPPMDPAAPLPQRFGMVMGMLNQTGMMKQFTFADPATDGRVKAAMKGIALNGDFAQTIFATPAIASYTGDLASATAGLTFPVLTITGKEDHMVGVDHYKSFRFPNHRVAVVSGKHYAFIEHPAEVATALASFIPSVAK